MTRNKKKKNALRDSKVELDEIIKNAKNEGKCFPTALWLGTIRKMQLAWLKSLGKNRKDQSLVQK